jgi:rod shape-determining protein MreD
MTIFRNIFRAIYFVIILFFETLINFLIGLDWIVISPFFLLIYFVSTKRFDNQNIIPLVISGLSYDVFLSENYLGVYSILFLLVAIISNYIQKRFQSTNYQEVISFTFGFLIYNTINLSEANFISFFVSSLLINYLIYFLYQRTLGTRV